MELPPARAADFGLRARKFRLRPGPDMSDRSCWTDTPVEKARKRKVYLLNNMIYILTF